MLLASAVVVWEWLNEHGRWRPYSPAVSHHIEAVIRSDPRGAGSVVLGQVDSRLSPYIIDLQSMHQFRQDTGKRLQMFWKIIVLWKWLGWASKPSFQQQTLHLSQVRSLLSVSSFMFVINTCLCVMQCRVQVALP
uniref:Deltex 4, E3 ubiquitin ligase a n=1 Tax=Cyprinus carpio carpio TaxID=630221 RepID=A0A9J7X670_CYPCA